MAGPKVSIIKRFHCTSQEFEIASVDIKLVKYVVIVRMVTVNSQIVMLSGCNVQSQYYRKEGLEDRLGWKCMEWNV